MKSLFVEHLLCDRAGFGEADGKRAQSGGRSVLGPGEPRERAEWGIIFRVGGGRFREDFLVEVITELVLKQE